jgi:hypothetical protein
MKESTVSYCKDTVHTFDADLGFLHVFRLRHLRTKHTAGDHGHASERENGRILTPLANTQPAAPLLRTAPLI